MEVGLTKLYSQQATVNRFWTHPPIVLPQIDSTEQFESLSKRQIIFGKPPKPLLGFESHHVMSFLVQYCYSYSRSVMLRGFYSADNEYFNGDFTSRIVWDFQNQKTGTTQYIFSLRFSFITSISDMHTSIIVHKKRKCTPLRSCRCGIQCLLGMRFVLYTINMEWMCIANYLTQKYRQYRRFRVNLAGKY